MEYKWIGFLEMPINKELVTKKVSEKKGAYFEYHCRINGEMYGIQRKWIELGSLFKEFQWAENKMNKFKEYDFIEKWNKKYHVYPNIKIENNEEIIEKLFNYALDGILQINPKSFETMPFVYPQNVDIMPIYKNQNLSIQYKANDIFTIMELERLELLRIGAKFDQCECGNWYIKKPKQKHNHCEKCPTPKKTKQATREYMREYRKNKKEEQIGKKE